MRGLIGMSNTTDEVMIENGDGTLSVYGAAAIEGNRVDLSRPVVAPASRSFLALLPDDQKPVLDLLIARGWKRGLIDFAELRDISLAVAKQDGIVLRLFGEFDDHEIGVDCIMSRAMYQRALDLMPLLQ